MKAAVCFEANSRLDVVQVEQEGPRAGEARVQVKAAGVCHSDWHIMNGDWPVPLPMVLGHEAAGVVQDVGPGVANVKPGDHVIFSFRPHCGHCYPYVMALQEKAIRGTLYGSVRPNVDFPILVDLYLAGRLQIDPLVSRTYTLDEINDGFAAMRGGQVARGVVVFDQ
jgi:Zn-dependent alcohol dehydrogenase